MSTHYVSGTSPGPEVTAVNKTCLCCPGASALGHARADHKLTSGNDDKCCGGN